MTRRSVLAASFLLGSCVQAAAEDVQQTIRDKYRETLAAMRTVKTEAELEQLIAGMDAPEWVGIMPADEPLTRDSVIREGRMALALAPEKRPYRKWISHTLPRPAGTYWLSTGGIATTERKSSVLSIAIPGCGQRRDGGESEWKNSFPTASSWKAGRPYSRPGSKHHRGDYRKVIISVHFLVFGDLSRSFSSPNFQSSGWAGGLKSSVLKVFQRVSSGPFTSSIKAR
jgi:hypothetical protein